LKFSAGTYGDDGPGTFIPGGIAAPCHAQAYENRVVNPDGSVISMLIPIVPALIRPVSTEIEAAIPSSISHCKAISQ
jgi:hypothetical protein